MGLGNSIQLLLEFRGDSSQLESDFAKARSTITNEAKMIGAEATAAFSQANTAANSLGSSILSLINPTNILIGAIVYAAHEFVHLGQEGIKTAEDLYSLHLKTGFLVEDLSAIKNVGATVGVEFQSISAGLGIFDKNLGLVQEGNQKMIKTFDALHISTKDNEQALRDAFTQLMKLPPGYERTTAAMQLFGRGGKELLAVIEETNGNLDEAIQKHRDLGTLIETKDAVAFHHYQVEMKQASQEMSVASMHLQEELYPALVKIVEVLAMAAQGWALLFQKMKEFALLPAVTVAEVLSPGSAVRNAAGWVTGAADEEMQARKAGAPDANLPFLGKGGGGKDPNADARRALEEKLKEREEQYKNHRERLEREYKLQLISLDSFTESQIAIETKRYFKEKQILEDELKLAKPGAETEKVKKELQHLELEHTKTIQKIKDDAAEKEIQSLQKHLDDMERIAQTRGQGQIDSIRELERLRVLTHEQAADRITKVEEDEADRRRERLEAERKRIIDLAGGDEKNANVQALREVDDALKQLEAEEHRIPVRFVDPDTGEPYDDTDKKAIGTKVAERLRRHAQARQQDLDEQKKYRDDLFALKQRTAQGQRDLDREMYEYTLNSPFSTIGQKKLAIDNLMELDLIEIDERRDQNKRILDEEEAQAVKELGQVKDKEKKKKEIHDYYEGLRKQEDERAKNERGQKQKEGDDAVLDASIWGGLTKELKTVGDVSQEVSKMMGDSFRTMAQGVGTLIQSFVLLGNEGGNSLRKLAAAAIASVAAQAAVDAIYSLAKGFVALAIGGPFAGHSAGFWFTAAALFGSIAGVSAAAGRVVAGNLFNQQGAGGSSDNAGTGSSSGQQYAPFQYGGNFSASQAGTQGSRTDNVLLNVLTRIADGQDRIANGQVQIVTASLHVANNVAALHDKIDSIPGDDLIRANPYAVGDSLQTAIHASHEIRDDITALGSTGLTKH